MSYLNISDANLLCERMLALLQKHPELLEEDSSCLMNPATTVDMSDISFNKVVISKEWDRAKFLERQRIERNIFKSSGQSIEPINVTVASVGACGLILDSRKRYLMIDIAEERIEAAKESTVVREELRTLMNKQFDKLFKE